MQAITNPTDESRQTITAATKTSTETSTTATANCKSSRRHFRRSNHKNPSILRVLSAKKKKKKKWNKQETKSEQIAVDSNNNNNNTTMNSSTTKAVVVNFAEEYHTATTTTTQHFHQHSHPDLENLYFIDKLTNERIHPNNDEIQIDNDIYKGKLLIMIRTCDADEKIEPLYTGGTQRNDEISNYFRQKKRRFEIQLQIQFKKVPTSQIYLAIEYEEPVLNMNPITRASVSAGLKFCKMRNPTFSYSLQGKEHATEEEKKQGLYENPHFAFPIESSLDVIKITKKGESPPTLGAAIYEDPEAIKRRHREGIEYNTEDTYTLCLWNAYVDFASWKAMNLPVPKFSLAKVNDAQPMCVKVYALNNNNNNNNNNNSTSNKENNDHRHLQKNCQMILDVEVNHRGITTFGNGARDWIQKTMSKLKHQSSGDGGEEDNVSSSTSSFYTSFSQSDFLDSMEDQKPKKEICCRVM